MAHSLHVHFDYLLHAVLNDGVPSYNMKFELDVTVAKARKGQSFSQYRPIQSKAATIDYFSSRLVFSFFSFFFFLYLLKQQYKMSSTISSTSRLVDEILHKIYSGLSLARRGPH